MPISEVVGEECDRRVLRKLKTIEQTLIMLFQMDRPTTIIQEKLEQMSELTANLPACFGEREFEDWSTKMASWWQQYSDMILKFQMKDRNSQNGFASQTNGFGCPPPDDTTVEVQMAKDLVRANVQHVFDLMQPIVDESDWVGLRRLLSAVAHARSLASPYWQDYQLHADIFYTAAQKLPPGLCHQYIQQYDPTQRRRSLRDLFRFLSEVLKEQVGDIMPQIQQQFNALPSVASPDDIDGMKSLLVEMTRALKMIASFYHGDDKDGLFARVFHFAAEKLHSELWEEFQQPADWTKTWLVRLKDMRHFVARKIITIHKETAEKGKSVDDILELMKHEFAQLDGGKEDEKDDGKLMHFEDYSLDHVKSLLRLVSKARAHLLTFREYDLYSQVQSSLFGMAFVKLPIDLKIKYARTDQDLQDKSLTELIKLLSNRIIESTIPQSEQTVRSVLENSGLGDPGFCNYCKSIGHQVEQCEILRAICCHKCFETGHQAKDCVGTGGSGGGSQDFCLECAQFGHAASLCPNAICFRCQQKGHMSRACTM